MPLKKNFMLQHPVCPTNVQKNLHADNSHMQIFLFLMQSFSESYYPEIFFRFLLGDASYGMGVR